MFRKTLTAAAGASAALALVAAPAVHAAPSNILAPATNVYTAAGEGMASGCTLGFIFEGDDGYAHALTARHCGSIGQTIHAYVDPQTVGPKVGEVEDVSTSDDIALVDLQNPPGTWDKVVGDIADVGGVDGTITPDELNRTRPMLCKTGVTTGTTCGQLTEDATTSEIHFDANGANGDSGSPVYAKMADGRILAAGILSGGYTDDESVAIPVTPYMEKWGLNVHHDDTSRS